MAIKGKKKTRGGAPSKRPAGAPRPVVPAGRSRTPWYRTRDGILIGSIFALVAIGVVIWLVSSARERSRELEAKRQAIQTYTDQLAPVLESVSDAASAMTAVSQVPGEEDMADLQEDATEWQQAFQQAQISLTSLLPPAEAEATHQLMNEALALYASAATTLGQLAEAEGNLIDQIFTTASTQRDLATSIFESTIAGFDTLRDELGMSASRLSAPASLGEPSMPDPLATVGTEGSVPPEGDGSGGGGKKGKGGDDG